MEAKASGLDQKVTDAMRDMSGGHYTDRAAAMPLLIIEEKIGTKSAQELGFVHAAEEQRFIQTDVPFPQRANHPFVRRSTAGSEQCGADRALPCGKFCLDSIQGRKKRLERPPAQWITCRSALTCLECLQAIALKDLLGLIGKQHGVTIESDTQFIAHFSGLLGRQNSRRCKACFQGAANIFGVSGEKQLRAEGREILKGAAATSKSGSGNAQAIVLDGIENAQAGVGAVA